MHNYEIVALPSHINAVDKMRQEVGDSELAARYRLFLPWGSKQPKRLHNFEIVALQAPFLNQKRPEGIGS